MHCLNALAERGLNMTKLESRPRPGSPWEYQFYVDFEGNATDPAVQDALNEMQRRALDVRVLGSYPSRTTPAARIERIPAGEVVEVDEERRCQAARPPNVECPDVRSGASLP